MKVLPTLLFLPVKLLIILGRKVVFISALEAVKKLTSELPSEVQM